MAFYAGVWRWGRFTVPLDVARAYAEALPEAIRREHARIESGEALPPFPKLDVAYVMELVGRAGPAPPARSDPYERACAT